MSPWCGMTNYIAVGALARPDYASGYNDQLNPLCKKDIMCYKKDNDSLYSCIFYDHPDWYIALKHRLTKNHINCFEQRTVLQTRSTSPFMKIYAFFQKYGCIDASTVHIKLSKKDYEQFSSGGMTKQWNRALERWVHDKIQQWDWRNFHNTLAPKQIDDYSASTDANISLLKFQEFTDDDIRYFCSAFYEVINKTSGKKNCIYIWGASSSGKTLILNIVKRLLVRFGSYTEQGGHFAFSEASYRTCFLFEDVSTIPIHSLSTIKKLWEGETTSINIKYKAPIQVQRTPCFVTSNYQLDAVFSKEQSHSEMITLNNRVFIFHFPNSFQFVQPITIAPIDFIRFIDDNREKNFNCFDSIVHNDMPTYNPLTGTFD